MSGTHPLSRRARLILGTLTLLLAGGISARIAAGGGAPDGDEPAAAPSEATLAKGPDGKPALQLASGQAQALDLKVAPAQVAPAADHLVLHGVVVDPLPLLDLEARRRAASSALQAAQVSEASARAEMARIRSLHAANRGASDRALQEAETVAAASSAQRQAAEGEVRKTQAAWTQNGLRNTSGLADFHRVVVRLDLPLGQPLPSPLPRTLTATVPGFPAPLTLSVVGLAPGGSPITGGLALLALAPGGGLRPGLPVDATLTGKAASRVLVPRTSLLWSEGQAQVFVEVGPGRFQPRPVDVAFSLDQAVALAGGLKKDEPVVVQGTLAVQGEFIRVAEGAAIGAGGV